MDLITSGKQYRHYNKVKLKLHEITALIFSDIANSGTANFLTSEYFTTVGYVRCTVQCSRDNNMVENDYA